MIYFIWQVVYEIACCILNRLFYISFIEKCCQEYYEDSNKVLINSKEIY